MIFNYKVFHFNEISKWGSLWPRSAQSHEINHLNLWKQQLNMKMYSKIKQLKPGKQNRRINVLKAKLHRASPSDSHLWRDYYNGDMYYHLRWSTNPTFSISKRAAPFSRSFSQMENINDLVFAFRLKPKVQIYVHILICCSTIWIWLYRLCQTIVHWLLLVEYDFIMKRDKWK